MAKLWKKQFGAKEEFSFVREDLFTDSDEIFLNNPLQIKGSVVNQGVFLELFLKIKTEVILRCSRCLEEIKVPLDLEVKEQYCSQEKQFHLPEVNVESMVRDSEGEEDWLNLRQIVREHVLLNLPMRILCTPDCPGICPECGRNLREGQCDCCKEQLDPRLAVLAQLKKQNLN